MNQIEANKAKLEEARAKLKEHCLCAKLNVDKSLVVVYLPYGYVFDAVQVHVGEGGVSKAMLVAEEKLEKIWQDSMWWKN